MAPLDGGCYAVSFGADEAPDLPHDGGDSFLSDPDLSGLPDLLTGDLISDDIGDLIEMTDVLVDDPPGPVTKPTSVRTGPASQVCSYEEIGEQTLSDCSADDFEMLFETAQPPKKNEGRSGSKSFGAKLAYPRSMSERGRSTAKSAGAVEKRSLLTDVDVLVS